MENKIYVITHKKMKLPMCLKNKGYELLSVGKAENNDGVQDTTGDSISNKNANYCELTGAYWIWKNIDADIKGFCHYRRFFTNKTLRYDEQKVLDITEAKKILDKNPNAIIVPEKKYFSMTAEELYLKCGYKKDLIITRDVIMNKYPEYVKYYDKLMQANYGYLTNMMIAKKKLFDDYSEWLFDILNSVERKTDLKGYSTAEARIYGYLSERLLGVWLEKNEVQTIEYQAINTENDNKLSYFAYRLSVTLGLYKYIKNVFFLLNKAKCIYAKR